MREFVLISILALGCTGLPAGGSMGRQSVPVDASIGVVPPPDYLAVSMPGGILLRYRTVSGDRYAIVGGHPPYTHGAFSSEDSAGRTVAIAPLADVTVQQSGLPVGPWEILIRNLDATSGVAAYQRIGGSQ